MKELIIFKNDGNFVFQYIDSFGKKTADLTFPVDILAHVQAIDAYVDTLQTPQELAFSFVVLNATDEQKKNMISVYPEYQIGKLYKVAEEFKHNEQLYRVIQGHTSQIDWVPGEVPALYLKIEPAGVIPNWVQPTGAQDAYNIDDHVIFEGQEYKSLINANVWSPTAYPAGWQLV